MDNEKSEDLDRQTLQERLEAFRFFELDKGRGTGDRFLQPWLYCHVYATGPRGRGVRKRAVKDLGRFFTQKDLASILEGAGQDRAGLLDELLFDSAAKYLAICRDDDGFGRKLFGLMRMKGEEKEDRIIRDVYAFMIPLLVSLSELEEAGPMIRALDRACRRQYPQRLEDMRHLIESRDDDAIQALLPPFDPDPGEGNESPSGP